MCSENCTEMIDRHRIGRGNTGKGEGELDRTEATQENGAENRSISATVKQMFIPAGQKTILLLEWSGVKWKSWWLFQRREAMQRRDPQSRGNWKGESYSTIGSYSYTKIHWTQSNKMLSAQARGLLPTSRQIILVDWAHNVSLQVLKYSASQLLRPLCFCLQELK